MAAGGYNEKSTGGARLVSNVGTTLLVGCCIREIGCTSTLLDTATSQRTHLAGLLKLSLTVAMFTSCYFSLSLLLVCYSTC